MRGIFLRLGKKLNQKSKIYICIKNGDRRKKWIYKWGIFLFASFLILFSPDLSFASSIRAEKIIELTNQARNENGLNPLSPSSQLVQAAQNKAEDMVKRNYWSHETPEGDPFWHFVEQVGYNWSVLGENLAADFETPQGVVNAWLGSHSHRRNILNKNYQEIGVGVSGNIVVAIYGKEGKNPLVNSLQALSKIFDNLYLSTVRLTILLNTFLNC